ncbi:MAG: insulinase family protein [Desulfovibrio sp.]|jgi:Zn-dependent M16 (insulinase) family peptidase|nr:insulinase family protein [Desulfovibrio sp.]
MSTLSHDFTLITTRNLKEIGGTASLWRHAPTGAQLLSVANKDENKCFGVNFRTPPKDSTGVAHILEHSVLCGSEKYPVKEPFVELLKGSLNTFLNAFTFPDKTCYPVASANLRDFYNLIDVYIDAVFHPRISKDIFAQEGWHVEAASADGPWTYKGVVYNEMKGAYSSQDAVLGERSQQSVFPDTLYSLDSGGDPERIPQLTYEEFRNFHSSYYHPSNARFFFWGDDPEEERLRLLSKALAGFGPKAVDSAIPPQPPLSSPRRIEVPYAADPGETRHLFTVNWLLGERGNVPLALHMEMLEHILEGLPGSPLRMAMIFSGLGEDTTGCGLETDLRQMYYSTGLKGVQKKDLDAAERLVLETLSSLAEGGIDPEAVEAAVNSVEFAYRERNSGRFPQGLAAMVQSLSTWLYDEDPLAPLAWEPPLTEIKNRLAKGEKVFEDLIRTHFLKNPHRTTVILTPDSALGAKRDADEAARVESFRLSLTPAARLKVVEETKRLHQIQLAPDSPEALATIPALHPGDLPRQNSIIPRKELDGGLAPILVHELPTQGIVYASLLLPLENLPPDLVPLVPLYSRCLVELGTGRRDFIQLGALIAAKTGGVGAMPIFTQTLSDRTPRAYLGVGGKAVYGKIDDLFAIITEILLEPAKDRDFIIERCRQMLLEEKAQLEQGLVAGGNGTVSLRLRARYTGADALNEACHGLSSLAAIRTLLARVDADPDSLLADLARVRGCIACRQGAVFDCTAEAEALGHTTDKAKELMAALPDRSSGVHVTHAPLALPAAEAILAQSQVNYVGSGANLYDIGYTFHGSANVILRYLRMGALWDQIRVKGGAYGATCGMDRLSGTLIFVSYRDPNVEATLQVYDSLASQLKNSPPDKAQLEQAIVGTIGDLDTYMLPDAKGARSLGMWMAGESDEMRQKMREEIFGVTAADFQAFGEVLAEAGKSAAICVLGGEAVGKVAKARNWSEQTITHDGQDEG